MENPKSNDREAIPEESEEKTRIDAALERARKTADGMTQMYRENPNFEVPY